MVERIVMQPEWRKKYMMVDMTTYDVAEWLKKTDMVILPVGSVEQHGPHMPIGCDYYTAMVVACGAAEKANLPIAPPIWFGITPYHMGKPGTITVRFSTFLNLLYDECRSLVHHGFNKILLCAGHHGNFPAYRDVSRMIKYETGALVVTFLRGSVAQKIAEKVAKLPPLSSSSRHGGEVETSGVLAWNPDLIRDEKIQAVEIKTPEWLPSVFKAKNANDVIFKGHTIGIPMEHYEISPVGNLGDPSGTEKGKEIYDQTIDYFVEVINEVKKISVSVHDREFINRV